MNKKYITTIGERFNDLTIIGYSRNKRNQPILMCKCICGKEITSLVYNIVNNKTKSCGCGKKKTLSKILTKYKVGSKLGLLTLIKEVGKDNKGKRKFTVQCECGTIKDISLHYSIKSCGCLKRTSKDPDQTEFNRYKHFCFKRDKAFHLTKNEFSTFIHKNCYYCGAEPAMKMHAGKQTKNGIDRLDSSKGYFLSNCISCCAKCNFAKRQLSVHDFLNLIKNIYEQHFVNN